jgi:hypothetical protein
MVSDAEPLRLRGNRVDFAARDHAQNIAMRPNDLDQDLRNRARRAETT